MINNKALVCSYVAKMFADGTKYHESIKESDNIGYIYDAVEELLNTKLSKQERKELPLDVQIIRLTERTKMNRNKLYEFLERVYCSDEDIKKCCNAIKETEVTKSNTDTIPEANS